MHDMCYCRPLFKVCTQNGSEVLHNIVMNKNRFLVCPQIFFGFRLCEGRCTVNVLYLSVHVSSSQTM